MTSRPRFGPAVGLCLLGLAVALLAPALAGEKPLLARVEGRLCSPLAGSVRGSAWRGWLQCQGAAAIDWDQERSRGDRILLDPLIPHSPFATDLDALNRPPGREHILGTDPLGRDVAARLIHGFPVAVLVGGLATLISLAVGLLVGAAAGAGGRWVNLAVTRAIDLAACFPSLVLALALVATVDRPGVWTLVLAIAATRWTGTARFFRAEVLRQRELTYCQAARAAGARRPYVLARHILPNALSPILVTAAFSVSSAILLESGMSFLGLGVSPPTPSWGAILAEAHQQVTPSWWLVLFPSLALFLTVMACTLLAEGYRDSTDPHLSRV